jgi:hypothetical protein
MFCSATLESRLSELSTKVELLSNQVQEKFTMIGYDMSGVAQTNSVLTDRAEKLNEQFHTLQLKFNQEVTSQQEQAQSFDRTLADVQSQISNLSLLAKGK